MIKKITKLYYKYQEIINYLIAGVLTTLVSIVSYFLIRTFILNSPNSNSQIQIATIISNILAIVFAFFINKIFVFKSKKKGKEEVKEMSKFIGARVFALLLEMLLMYIIPNLLHINDKIAKIIVQFVNIVVNYLTSKLLVFKK